MNISEKYYDNFISLGYNCEVAYQFFKYHGFVESSLFTWTNTINVKNLIFALNKIDDIFSQDVENHPPMWKCVKTNIRFHGKKSEDTESEKKELLSRVSYLKSKFISVLNNNKKTLLVFKYKTDENENITNLYNAIKNISSNSFDLLVIFEKNIFLHDLEKINQNNVYIRFVSHFAPENAVTSKNFSDKEGWIKIYNEFKPNFKLKKTKKFKFEDISSEKKKKIKLKNKKYDFVFGMGEACSCTQMLRMANLQHQSNPFDWLYGSDFSGRVDILTSEFDRYINKEDLELVSANNSCKHNPCCIYHNKLNNITFNHDFPTNMPLDKSYPIVFEKYDRRIKRLFDKINNANSVLIVYIETPNCSNQINDNQTLLLAYDKIIKKYPDKNITLLYFTRDEMKTSLQEDFISDNIIKISGDYKSKKDGDIDYAIDRKMLINYLSKYKLNLPMLFFLKKKMVKLLITVIPSKKIKKSLRKKYHV